MIKILLFLCVLCTATLAFGQGSTIEFLNNPSTIHINTVSKTKSKLIKYDSLHFTATDQVVSAYEVSRKASSSKEVYYIEFTYFIPVYNFTNQTIWCTKELLAYNDTQIRDYESNVYSDREFFVPIKSHSHYKIPVIMMMGMKTLFQKSGQFIVFSKYRKIIEAHEISIESTFQPEQQYKLR